MNGSARPRRPRRRRRTGCTCSTTASCAIFHVRVWLNEGKLSVGDDIMLVLIGGDIRPHVIDALQSLVGEIKNECVREQELY